MFKKLFQRWQKPAAAPASPNPFLAVELDVATGKIKGFAHFPQPADKNAAQEMANGVGVMAFLLNDGRLLPVLQQAIGVAGVGTGLEGVSQIALGSLTGLLQEKAQQEEQGSQPLIRPTAAFSPNRPGSME